MLDDIGCNTQGTVFTVLAFKLEEEAQGTAQKTRSKYDGCILSMELEINGVE